MKRFPRPMNGLKTCRVSGRALVSIGLLLFALSPLRADQIEMRNGDKYNAKVVSMNSETVVIQSDVLGTLKLPRSQVANVVVGAPANSAAAPATQSNLQTVVPPAANQTNDVSSSIRQLATETNLVQQVQNQYLGGADPAAKAKFNELLTGLSTGTLNMNDLRAQAKTAADQLRALKKEAGGSADEALDSYLAILDSFLKETSSADTPAAKAPSAQPNTKPSAATPQE